MACLPNCGVLDLTSIRPRRAQDLIFHSMNLTPAAQYAHSGSCQAGLAASGSTHEAHAHWDSCQTINALAMHNGPVFLGNGVGPTGAFPRTSAPSPAEPVLASLIGAMEDSPGLQYCTATVDQQHATQDIVAPRRPPKRAASRSLDHYAPAKRGAFSLPAGHHFPADADMLSRPSSNSSNSNWWPAQRMSLPPCHISQPPPSTLPCALDENTTAAILASLVHGLPKQAQSNRDMHEGQLCAQATAPGVPAGAAEANASMSSGAVHSLHVEELFRQCGVPLGALPAAAYQHPVAPSAGQLAGAAGGAAHHSSDDVVHSQLQQLQAALSCIGAPRPDAHLDAPMQRVSDSGAEQHAAVSGAAGYAPTAADMTASLLNAASAEAQLAHLQSVMGIAPRGISSAHQSTHITPVAMTAANSAHSVHTAAQVPGEDPFRYLQQSPGLWCDSQDPDQLSQQHDAVAAPQQMHAQPVGFQAIDEEPLVSVSEPRHRAFGGIYEHDAAMCRSLTRLRTTCPEENACAAAPVATHACASDAAPLVTSVVPLITNAVNPALGIAPLAPVATVPAQSGNVLPATAATLEMLQLLQPADQAWQPHAVTTGAVAVPGGQLRNKMWGAGMAAAKFI